MTSPDFSPDELRFKRWLKAFDTALATAKTEADFKATWLLWLDPLVESDIDTREMCAAMKRRHLQRFEHEKTQLPTSKKFASGHPRVIMRHLLLGISTKLAPMLVIAWSNAIPSAAIAINKRGGELSPTAKF